MNTLGLINAIDTEFVTNKQWDRCARRIEKSNFSLYGRSLTATGIARLANKYIVEIQSDRDGMIVVKGWREAMRKGSDEWHKKDAQEE